MLKDYKRKKKLLINETEQMHYNIYIKEYNKKK